MSVAGNRARSRIWLVRGELPLHVYWMIAAAGFVLPIAGWWWLAASGGVDPAFLPTPPQVIRRVWSWWHDEQQLFNDAWISVFRVSMGFLLSAIMALPLALLIGVYKPVQAFFEPLTDFIRYMPAVAFIPLTMLWVGIGEGSKIGIIWIGTFFQMLLMMAEDVRRVPLAQIEAAQTLGANRDEIITYVIFPSARPALLDTLRVTMGWAWTYLVVAELVAANEGLGYAILRAQRFLQTDKIFAGILLIGLIGLATDQAFRLLHRLAFPWLRRA